MSSEGMAQWKGSGIGRPTTGPGVWKYSYGGVYTIATPQKWQRLLDVYTAGEYENDTNGNYRWKLWEWKFWHSQKMLRPIAKSHFKGKADVAIPPTWHNKLIVALRTTAVENGEGSLDKQATSHDDDLFDAFRLRVMFWHWLKERRKYPRIRH
jgi:hypothetical protein